MIYSHPVVQFHRVRPGHYRVDTFGPHEFRALAVRLTDGTWEAAVWTFGYRLGAPTVHQTLAEAQQEIRSAAYAIGA